MINWLYSLPEGRILVLFSASLVVLIIVLPQLVGRLPWLRPSDANTDFALRVQTTLFSMTSLVLAFSLVQADINFRQAEAAVSAEAARIDQLDRLLTRYGDDAAQQVRPLLRAYALSIAQDEWPIMQPEVSSDKTRAAFATVSRRILVIDPAPGRQSLIFAEMLKSLDAIAESRAMRLHMLGVGLPVIYWIVVLFALSMLTFVSCTIRQTPFRRALLSVQAAVLGAFVGFVFVMDQPFKGQSAIGPDAFMQAISRMDVRRE